MPQEGRGPLLREHLARLKAHRPTNSQSRALAAKANTTKKPGAKVAIPLKQPVDKRLSFCFKLQ